MTMAKQTHRYKVVAWNGKEINFTSGAPLSLEEMQTKVGGYIEIVGRPGPNVKVYADEEGRLKNRRPNKKFPGLVGTVVVEEVLK